MYWTNELIAWIVFTLIAGFGNIWAFLDAIKDYQTRGKGHGAGDIVARWAIVAEGLRSLTQTMYLSVGLMAATLPPVPPRHPIITPIIAWLLILGQLMLVVQAAINRIMRYQVYHFEENRDAASSESDLLQSQEEVSSA